MSSLEKIQPPPPLEQLLAEVSSATLAAGLRLPPDQEYRHWNDFRNRPAPEGQTKKSWWLANKLSRLGSRLTLPLQDVRGHAFSYMLTSQALRAIHEIDRNAAGGLSQSSSETSTLRPEARERYFVSSLIQEAIASSQLEGAVTTRRVAKEMLRTNRAPVDESERMMLNNYLAMKQIVDWQNKPLSIDLIHELHSILTRDTLPAKSVGRFRQSDERVTVEDDFGNIYHHPPPAKGLEKRVLQLCDFANQSEHEPFIPPVIRAIILHFWLAYEHPFVDGNGRTARALFYWAMRRYGYWLIEYTSISHIILKAPKSYYRAFIYSETDDNDLNYFIHYHLNVIREAIRELHEYIERKNCELSELTHQLKAMQRWNPRQQALLAHALRHPDAHYTVKSHQNSHRVVYQTARTDLLKLRDAGLLVEFRRGLEMTFRAPLDLAERLRKP